MTAVMLYVDNKHYPVIRLSVVGQIRDIKRGGNYNIVLN